MAKSRVSSAVTSANKSNSHLVYNKGFFSKFLRTIAYLLLQVGSLVLAYYLLVSVFNAVDSGTLNYGGIPAGVGNFFTGTIGGLIGKVNKLLPSAILTFFGDAKNSWILIASIGAILVSLLIFAWIFTKNKVKSVVITLLILVFIFYFMGTSNFLISGTSIFEKYVGYGTAESANYIPFLGNKLEISIIPGISGFTNSLATFIDGKILSIGGWVEVAFIFIFIFGIIWWIFGWKKPAKIATYLIRIPWFIISLITVALLVMILVNFNNAIIIIIYTELIALGLIFTVITLPFTLIGAFNK
jgi:hypothetical protein